MIHRACPGGSPLEIALNYLVQRVWTEVTSPKDLDLLSDLLSVRLPTGKGEKEMKGHSWTASQCQEVVVLNRKFGGGSRKQQEEAPQTGKKEK